MKPVYCNTASVSHNRKTDEVAISFSNIYTEHRLSVDGNGITDVSAKVAEEEAHVIMSAESFLALKKLLDSVQDNMSSRQ
ncbi:MAG: hypothetical protein MR033_08620 [Clostridiales bacterium]|nr:hypothetical protein [Clostridiales bacterium]